jgi:hypothetical protein
MRQWWQLAFDVAAAFSAMLCVYLFVTMLWAIHVGRQQLALAIPPGGNAIYYSHEFYIGFGCGPTIHTATAIYLTMALPITWILTEAIGRYRRQRPSGHCRECGYNLTGNVSRVCPECGTPIAAKA